MNENATSTTELLKCDLVMQGGITSGIVYPSAIGELAQTYRFCSIGGASAGAIAAALTAAAEYKRQVALAHGADKADASRDFSESLHGLANELCGPSSSKKSGKLLSLFQPTSEMRPLFEIFLLLLKGKTPPQKFLLLWWGMLRYMPWACAFGFVAALIPWCILYTAIVWPYASHLWRYVGQQVTVWLAAVLLALLIGGLFGGIVRLIRLIGWDLPQQRNDFGVCPGHGNGQETDPPLTDWLHKKINNLAGLDEKDPPLTIRSLEDYGIVLRMITTCLSQEQPYMLPFEQRNLYFKGSEFERLFPKQVVAPMITLSDQRKRETEERKGHRIEWFKDYHFLPDAKDLPVVLMARMSLSFPVLLAAVPLYTLTGEAYSRARAGEPLEESRHLQRLIFTDGGITNNFPIQLFDAWYPERPTFGIQLTSWPSTAFDDGKLKAEYISRGVHVGDESDPAQKPEEESERDAVYLPPANVAPSPVFHRVDSLPAFLMGMFSTAQNFRDRMLSQLPSYRERIVQIRLKDDEGGLNLDMPDATLKELVKRGQLAGKTLQRFDTRQHQWVRFLVLMHQLVKQTRNLKLNLCEFNRLVKAMEKDPTFPYHRKGPWITEAKGVLKCLDDLVRSWRNVTIFDDKHPKPGSTMRVTPDPDISLAVTTSAIGQPTPPTSNDADDKANIS